MLRSPHYEFPRRPAAAVANPEITAKPSLEGINLLHRRGSDLACAEACINSAIVKSTTCTLGDLLCECQSQNALSIWLGSSNCAIEGCGVSVWQVAYSSASRACVTAIGGQYTAPTVVVTSSVQTASGAATSATNGSGNGNGSGSGTTSTGAIPGSSSAGAAAGASSSSSSSSSGSTSSSLAPGAIAGIAIGGVAVGILLCLALFLMFRWGRSSGQKKRGAAAAAAAAANGQTPSGLGAASSATPADAKTELDGTNAGVASSTASPYNTGSMPSATAASRAPPPVSSSPPPVYPGWQYHPGLSQQPHEVSGAGTYHRNGAQEMHATSWRPEMGGDSPQMRHEMPAQAYRGGVHEMSSGPHV